MAEKSFAAALNEQISNEFAASQQYVAAAVYYDAETLPRLAAFFYRQALEEREHAMMMIRYLLDVGEEVQIPDIKSVPTTYADGSQPVKMALEQEKRVSDEIFSLFELARELKDYRAEQFLQWFVKEQVEEVALMGDLLNVVERSRDNLLLAEDFIARESFGAESSDPTAPPAADGRSSQLRGEGCGAASLELSRAPAGLLPIWAPLWGAFIGLHFRRFATFRRGGTAPLHATAPQFASAASSTVSFSAKRDGSASPAFAPQRGAGDLPGGMSRSGGNAIR